MNSIQYFPPYSISHLNQPIINRNLCLKTYSIEKVDLSFLKEESITQNFLQAMSSKGTTATRGRTFNALTSRYKVATSLLSHQETLFSMSFQHNTLYNEVEASFVQFSSEIGRIHLKYKWPSYIKMIAFSILLLFAATGILDSKTYSTNQVDRFILRLIQYLAISPNLTLSGNNDFIYPFVLFILLIATNSFTLYLLHLYKTTKAPSTFTLNFWIVINQIVLPLFSLVVGNSTGYFIGLIFKETPSVFTVVPFIFAILNVIFFTVAMIVQASIYCATPLIRHYDISQCWFAFARFDLLLSFMPCIYSAIPGVLGAFIPNLVVSIVFMICVIIVSTSFSIYLLFNHPYILPRTNLWYLVIFVTSIFVSVNMLVAELKNSIIIYLFIAYVVILLTAFIVCKYIMGRSIHRIVSMFEECRHKNEDEITNPLLPINFLGQEEAAPNFDSFLEIDNLTLSLCIRFGYIFDIPEVIHHSFAKWVYDTGSKDCNLVFVIAQITFLVGKDMNHLGVVQQNAATFKDAPMNSRSFLYLLKCLREELLTQLNESMMTALGQAKLANRRLMTVLCEFWGFVLKQNIDGMQSLLPRIADESYETELLFKRLFRWYPTSSLVLREIMLFYHKSIGQHSVANRFHSLFNKYKRNNGRDLDETSDSTVSVSFKGDDEGESKFQQKLDPWLAAEDALIQVPNKSKMCLISYVIISFIILFGISVAAFITMFEDCRKFVGNFTPVDHISEIQFLISRIPQLLRIAQFHELGIVDNKHYSGVGEPFGEELTILNKSIAIETASQYTKIGISSMKQFLSHCTYLPSIYHECLVDEVSYVTNNYTITKSSAYELISSFFNDARDLLLRQDSIDWTEVQNEKEMFRLMNNFDQAFTSTSKILENLADSLRDINWSIKKKSAVFYIIIWSLSTLVIFPYLIYLVFYIKRDLIFLMRLLFNIPKSEISTLHWSTRGKPRKSISEESKKTLTVVVTNTDSVSELNGKANIRAEEVLEDISTVERKIGGIFSPIIITSIVFWAITCVLATIGIWLYSEKMLLTIKSSRSYEKCVASASCVLTVNYYFQEAYASNRFKEINVSLTKMKTEGYASYFFSTFDELLFGNEEDDLSAALLSSEDIIKTFTGNNLTNLYNETTEYEYESFLSINHETYNHISCQALVSTFKEVTRMFCKENYTYGYDSPLPYHLQHMTYAHLHTIITDASVVMYQNSETMRKKSESSLFSVFIPLIIFQVLYMITIFNFTVKRMLRYVDLPRVFFRLVMPNVLLKTQPIVKWMAGALDAGKLVGHHDSNAISRGVNSDFVLPYSKCALILTNQELIIEDVTEMTCTLFNRTKEGMINENIMKILSRVIINKDKAEILDKIKISVEKMIAGRSKSGKREFTIIIKSSNDQEMYLELFLRGHSKRQDEADMITLFRPQATAFSLVFYDKTAEHFQEELVQFEKKRGEQLLASFTPPAIFKRLSDGETEIFFEVPSATILFSSITNWSNMIQTMTASDVMKILNKLYMAYDEILKMFPAVTKLKTIGHIYMIACGLFTDSSVNHADTTIRFSLKMFECVCQVNDENGWNLSISVGINTGGPINCGIIGKTRPIFDIIGDPVNFASKINTNGMENYIQISETTYDLIKYLSYPIRERGEIFIKGKGMKKVYLISPQSHLSLSGLNLHNTENSLENVLTSSQSSLNVMKNNLLTFTIEERSSEMMTVPEDYA
ncbi:guanylate cyclase [Tritrichomonas foetus]|uniref:Guanylate cyclase n=1 Tax=Tritrichomonas foetus TaxID=1144522 RepID=A0A1J4JYB0_9EUKA|nr:guanylate cyclase [Tritrichomonas foetus]|eukprot:OHT03979.1 guanylate cyclase [Tritrichomonas foetus]